MSKPSFLAAAALLATSGLHAETLYALTTDNRLITLDTASPALGSAVALSGLADTEVRDGPSGSLGKACSTFAPSASKISDFRSR